MTHTETAMNIGTCEPRYRDFNRKPQHQQLTYFYNVYFIFIDWSVAFYRVFNLLNGSCSFDVMPCQRRRTPTMPGPTSGSAPSSEWHLAPTGDKSWTTGVKASDLGVRLWLLRENTGMRFSPMAPSSTRRTPYAITGTYQGRGRCSLSINPKTSRKRMWSTSTSRFGHMCGLSWERKLRPVQTFSNPGRGSTLNSNLWRISKTSSPLPSISSAASLDIKRRSSMPPHRLIKSSG